jgi:hypothetical protein
MTNPFQPHTSNLFGSRGCDIDAALQYARELIDGMPVEAQASANTAVMVLVNTAAAAFRQAIEGKSPERLAVEDMVRALVQRQIGDLDSLMDEWARNSMVFDDLVDSRVESWVENNLDLEDAVLETVQNLDFSVTVSR